jgi:hypothetical protein
MCPNAKSRHPLACCAVGRCSLDHLSRESACDRFTDRVDHAALVEAAKSWEVRTDPYDPTKDTTGANRPRFVVTVFNGIERDVREFKFVVECVEAHPRRVPE